MCRQRKSSKSIIDEIHENETGSGKDAAASPELAFVTEGDTKGKWSESNVLCGDGSTLNIISSRMVEAINPKPELKSSTNKAFALGQSQPLSIKGQYTYIVESNDNFTTATFHEVRKSTTI